MLAEIVSLLDIVDKSVQRARNCLIKGEASVDFKTFKILVGFDEDVLTFDPALSKSLNVNWLLSFFFFFLLQK